MVQGCPSDAGATISAAVNPAESYLTISTGGWGGRRARRRAGTLKVTCPSQGLCALPQPRVRRRRRAPGAGRRAEQPGDTRTAWGVRAKQASQAVGATRTQFAVCVGRTGQGGRGAARPRRL